jgi:hypothetical protein
MLALSSRTDLPQPENAALENPIRALTEECADLNNRAFAGVLLLIPAGNPFAGQKKPFYTSETRLVLSRDRMDEKIDGLLTTGHLLWLNERRSAACLLPIRLPNPSFPGGKYNKKPTGRPGGRSRECIPQATSNRKAHTEFLS